MPSLRNLQAGLAPKRDSLSGNLSAMAVTGAARLAGPLLVAARIGLEDFGRFALGLSVSSVFVIVTDGGLGRLALRRRSEDDRSELSKEYCARAVAVSTAGSFLLSPALFALSHLALGMSQLEAVAMAVMMTAQSLSVTLADLRRSIGDSTRAILSTQIPIALLLPASALLVLPNTAELFLVVAGSFAVSSAWLWGNGFGSERPSRGSLARDLRDGLGFAIFGGLSTLSNASPMLLASSIAPSTLGTTALALRLYQIQNSALAAADATFVPRLSQSCEQSQVRHMNTWILRLRSKNALVALSSGLAALTIAGVYSWLTVGNFAAIAASLSLLLVARLTDAALGYNSEALLILGHPRFVNITYVTCFCLATLAVTTSPAKELTTAPVLPWCAALVVWNMMTRSKLKALAGSDSGC